MFESLGFETLTAPQAALILAAALGLLFGLAAERSAFCFRRALVGEDARQARGVWAMGFGMALIGTQASVAGGLISFGDHRFHADSLPLAAILLGGALFGAGMVLTRGCISRLTVLGATGNLRAITVVVLFAITAHATLKGVLTPLRTGVAQFTVPSFDLTAFGLPLAAILAAAALLVAIRSGEAWSKLAWAALLGLLVPVAWVGTGLVLFDDFDPIAMESLAFTSSVADGLFYTVASTAISPSFGAVLVAGVLVGAFLSAAAARRLRLHSFTAPRETLRYGAGAVLMGVGGVLAGGCTVGAGLSGTASMSLAAFIALAAMAAGALATQAALRPRAMLQPAE